MTKIESLLIQIFKLKMSLLNAYIIFKLYTDKLLLFTIQLFYPFSVSRVLNCINNIVSM